MRSSSCQIEFDNGDGDTIRCGKPTEAMCSDCGVSACADCSTECCGESFCDYCYQYHVEYFCLRKPAQAAVDPRRDKDAA